MRGAAAGGVTPVLRPGTRAVRLRAASNRGDRPVRRSGRPEAAPLAGRIAIPPGRSGPCRVRALRRTGYGSELYRCRATPQQDLTIPKMGIIMPDMGIHSTSRKPASGGVSPPRRSVADALFSSTQRRVLGLLFGEPARSFFASEIIERVGAGSGAVQRELRKLVESGLVTVSWVGKQKHFQANPDSPIFHELCSLIRKTVGLTEPLKKALEPHQRKIELALVYGSVAKRSETAASDIDLLLVSDALSLEQVYRAVADAERELGRSVNPTLYTTQEFSQRRRQGNPFLKRVLGGETIVLLGSLNHEA